MKILFILIFFFVSLFGIEIDLDKSVEDLNRDKKDIPYFGESLFQGEFRKNKKLRYTPKYLINIGDIISVKLWGAYNYAGELRG